MMEHLLCLKASAGSGKTFSLAKRYIGLLYLGAKPSQILAVTFTNKAANEMRQRIVKYLRELENEEDFLNALAQELDRSKEELLKRRAKLLQEFLTSDLHILTMDAFFNKIARKFSYMIGLEPDFEMAKDDVAVLWKLFLEHLSPDRFEALVKLSKMQSRLQEFFEGIYEKEKELPKLHWNVSSNAKRRFEALQQEMAALLDGCSKTAYDLVQKSAEGFLGSKRISTILTHGTIKYKGSIFNKCYSQMLDSLFFELIDTAKEVLIEKENYLKNSIFDFYNHYKLQKKRLHLKENYLDFKDVEHLVYELLQEREFERDFLYFRLDSKIKHILIDEFQDTSITQWKIFEPLVDEIKSEGDFRSFFYVGDTKQAIYRFRGGSSELFDAVYESLAPFGMKIEPLEVNYRSKKEIVEFVNELFDLNEKAKEDEGGYVKVLRNPCVDEKCVKFEWQENLVKIVDELLKAGAKPSSIGVLVYKNSTIVEVADLLKERLNVKSVTTSSKQVIHQPKARAVIELMKAIYYGTKGRLHLANFNSFVGQKFDEKVEIAIDRPAKMVREVLDRFNLWDTSTIKLLEHALSYEQLIDFVYHIESFSQELSNETIEGVNVMTIHKAKGLEFEHVIVLDSVPNDDLPLLLYDYEGIDIKDVRLQMELLEKVDEEYKRVVEKERALIEKDQLNREYVAYTRAKDSLWILQNEPVEEKNSSSLLALARSGLHGEWGRLEISNKPENGDRVEKYSKKLQVFGKQEHKKEKEYEPNEYEAIYLGLAAHALFEMDGNDYALNRYGAYCDYQKAKEFYEKAKSYEEYRKLLKGEIFKELPFIYKGQSGVIDLMIESEDEIIIIDYKSAKPKDEESYKKQVRFYMEAMKSIRQKRVRGFIYYIDKCELKEVL